MKQDIRIAATNEIETLLTSSCPGLVPVRVGKRNCFAIPTSVTDENGATIYATVEVTIKNATATDTVVAFDFEEAKQARTEYDARPKSETKGNSVDDEEKRARKKKREQEQEAVRVWCAENLTDTPMTTTDIKNAMPELAEVTIMQFGTYLKAIANDEANGIVRKVEKGKPFYSKA